MADTKRHFGLSSRMAIIALVLCMTSQAVGCRGTESVGQDVRAASTEEPGTGTALAEIAADERFDTELFAMDHPVLDKLNVKASVAHNNPQDQPHLTSLTPVSSGSFQSGNGWQMVKFEKPVTGRYVALQALSTHDGKGEVCIAEVYARGIDGQRLSREPWTVVC